MIGPSLPHAVRRRPTYNISTDASVYCEFWMRGFPKIRTTLDPVQDIGSFGLLSRAPCHLANH